MTAPGSIQPDPDELRLGLTLVLTFDLRRGFQ
jgi:hypothetical protein